MAFPTTAMQMTLLIVPFYGQKHGKKKLSPRRRPLPSNQSIITNWSCLQPTQFGTWMINCHLILCNDSCTFWFIFYCWMHLLHLLCVLNTMYCNDKTLIALGMLLCSDYLPELSAHLQTTQWFAIGCRTWSIQWLKTHWYTCSMQIYFLSTMQRGHWHIKKGK